MIKNLLENQFVIAGDLKDDNTFHPWNKSLDEIIVEIKNKWDSLNQELQPHEIVWFEITQRGRKEFEYLNSLNELEPEGKNHYIRICEGG